MMAKPFRFRANLSEVREGEPAIDGARAEYQAFLSVRFGGGEEKHAFVGGGDEVIGAGGDAGVAEIG